VARTNRHQIDNLEKQLAGRYRAEIDAIQATPVNTSLMPDPAGQPLEQVVSAAVDAAVVSKIGPRRAKLLAAHRSGPGGLLHINLLTQARVVDRALKALGEPGFSLVSGASSILAAVFLQSAWHRLDIAEQRYARTQTAAILATAPHGQALIAAREALMHTRDEAYALTQTRVVKEHVLAVEAATVAAGGKPMPASVLSAWQRPADRA
jgi:hypothetical protein